MHVHIFFENEAWMPPLREALARRGLPVKEHFADGGYVNIHNHPPKGVYINRMSPSAHTRGHQGGVLFCTARTPLSDAGAQGPSVFARVVTPGPTSSPVLNPYRCAGQFRRWRSLSWRA